MTSFPLSETDASAGRRELRRLLRARRRDLPSVQQRRAAHLLVRHAVRQRWYVEARSIAAYIAADGEIDPAILIRRALRDGKRVCLPRLMPGNRLVFIEYRAGERLRRNRFGIPEPYIRRIVATMELDVVLLPLVGFDDRGNRLGMGGGFYDRTFAASRQAGRARIGAPRLIGLAHSFQQVDSLPEQPWDVPLSGVLTERRWIAAARRSVRPASR